MGCDIHLFAEKKVDGKWECIYGRNELYSNRNYMLFSILADVRNGGDVICISGPKGIPVDASPSVLDYVGEWGSDLHSKSFLTVKELLEYDWTQCVDQVCYMTKAEYIPYKIWQKWEPHSIPSKCEYYTNKPSIDENDYVKVFAKMENDYGLRDLESSDTETMIKVSYREMYAQYLQQFFLIVIPLLLKECDGDFESVRIVFGFDN